MAVQQNPEQLLKALVRIADLPGAVGKRVIGGKELFADAYVDVPPQPNTCKGATAQGGELSIVYVPMVNGGTAPACVQYCPQHVAIARDPAVPTVVATTYVEPRKSTANVEPKKPAVPTVIATSHVEPGKPAVPTVVATPYVEPPVRRPPAGSPR